MKLKQIVSFREFLSTGKLGPISTDMALKDVAKALGSPSRFYLHVDTPDVPIYWCYGKLEISFAEEPPYTMSWFQIEFAGDLEGDFEKITEDLIVTLDGLGGDTPPSQFLRAGLWANDEIKVLIGALSDDVVFTICAGTISIHFRIDSSFIADGDAVRYVESNDISQIARDIDSRTDLDSIYSHPSHELAIPFGDFAKLRVINGSEYLAALDTVQKKS